MTLPEGAEKTLTEAVAAGAQASAARLEEATRDPWRVGTVDLSVADAGPFAAEHASVSGDHYGCHFTFPGGSIVVLFSGKSGYRVTAAFTRDHQDAVENLAKRESLVLGEVANILLNPLIGRLADVCDARIIISAPKTRIASPRDHLTDELERYRAGEPLAASFFISFSAPRLSSECRVLLFLDRSLAGRIAVPGAAPP